MKVKRGKFDSKGIAYHAMVSVFDERQTNQESLVNAQSQ